jgi:endo-1,4-beta-D-glucanase Y
VLVLMLTFFGCEKGTSAPPVLSESWNSYVKHFMQSDGRVIDHSADGISTSEGQAYAMLRAVWVGDRDHFDKAFMWAVNNLNSGIREDHLWAWKWGKDDKGQWRVLDKAFASDADEDAALALVLASRVWKRPQYADDARAMLRDLWNKGTIEAGGHRYLLAGDTLCQGTVCRINPSYYAPYAYRVFADFDREHNWPALIDTSYHVLNTGSGFARTGLPPNWVQLDRTTGELMRLPENDGAFSYDAFRVYWRIELDRVLFHEPRADEYIRQSTQWTFAEWEKHKKLPAVISADGKPLASYESLEMLSALMCAMHNDAMYKKLQSTYSQGVWADGNKYYLQNWAWFGTAVYTDFLGPLQLLKSNP